MPRDKEPKTQKEHCYANCLIKADLSTLTWLKGPLNIADENVIKLQYASLNFKDIMIALGRIPDTIHDRFMQHCSLGIEVSGTRKNGSRVMGIALNTGGISTHYHEKLALLWDVPQTWSLEQAATVPLVYTTVYFAYFVTTQIRAGKTILIHSGSGGVGQAAIEIAFAYGLDVFTTVSSEEKKNFLLQKFPKLKPENVGNSRNTSFEKLILSNTNGKGVDYVLNSLADEKLHASIRCLGKGGTLLEIGKYDMVKGTKLDMRYLAKRISFKAVVFDDLPPDSEEMEASLIYSFLTLTNILYFFFC
jgi:fatty acid synthase